MYLPNTNQRIENLRRIINKRTVVILLNGTSVAELEERKEELKDVDICYASLNAVWSIEKHILSQIDKRISVYLCASIPGLEEEIENIEPYLKREDDNLFISTERAFSENKIDAVKIKTEFDAKLLFFDVPDDAKDFMKVPNKERPLHFPPLNSLTGLLNMCVIGESPKVVVFGADGGKLDDNLYYKQEEMTHRQPSIESELIRDTRDFNNLAVPSLNRTMFLYNSFPVIYNCSPKSLISTLRKANYDEAIKILHE